jgi:hypothetical protein
MVEGRNCLQQHHIPQGARELWGGSTAGLVCLEPRMVGSWSCGQWQLGVVGSSSCGQWVLWAVNAVGHALWLANGRSSGEIMVEGEIMMGTARCQSA